MNHRISLPDCWFVVEEQQQALHCHSHATSLSFQLTAPFDAPALAAAAAAVVAVVVAVLDAAALLDNPGQLLAVGNQQPHPAGKLAVARCTPEALWYQST